MSGDREKLVELLRQCVTQNITTDPDIWDGIVDVNYGGIADHILANGVIVLPCKVGDDLWWIDAEDWSVKVDKGGVKGIAITADGVRIMDGCGGYDEIGTQYCYLSREEAEAALKEGQ